MAERGNREVFDLATLLRDAQPTRREIADEADPRRRKERQRAYELARDALVRMYLEAEAEGRLAQLDPAVRDICHQWKEVGGGKLQRPKGGALADEHWRMMLHMAVRQRLEGTAPQKVTGAIRRVAEESGRSYEAVRTIWYDPDPEWQRAANADWARLLFESNGELLAPIDVTPRAVNPTPNKRRRRRSSRPKNPSGSVN
jgi:hypothetical protein